LILSRLLRYMFVMLPSHCNRLLLHLHLTEGVQQRIMAAKDRREEIMPEALEITTIRGAPAPIPSEQNIDSLFAAFLAFIDRSEKTTETYAKNWRQFSAWLHYQGIEAPTRDDILAYRAFLSSEHEAICYDPLTGWRHKPGPGNVPMQPACKPSTIAQYLRTVAAFFKWTAEIGKYPNIAAGIHAPSIRSDTHRKEALIPADVLRIERSIEATAAAQRTAAAEAGKDTAGRVQRATEQGNRLRALFLLAVCCGLRTIELSRANVRDIETKNEQAYLYIWGKGSSEPDTRKPLAPEVKAALDDYIQSRSDNPTGSSPLFVSTGNRSRGKRIASTTISTMLKHAMQAAGYDSERITAHSLRHTAGTCVMTISGDLYITQKYMRHKNPATTEIYLHNQTEGQEADIAQRLYSFYHSEAKPEAAAPALVDFIKTLTPAQLDSLRAAIR